MSTVDQPTCGKGLAENSILPAKLGEVLDAMAENLEIHRKALDLTDHHSRAEFDAYDGLVKELRQSASQLEATARHMAGYRDLPMGRHDEQAMTDPGVREAFEKFMKQKHELVLLLKQTSERDDQLLAMMDAQPH